MPEPDFAGLRAEVEAATRLPQFETVVRRSRHTRRRDRGARALAALGTVAALVPVGLVALNAAPGAGGRPQEPDGRPAPFVTAVDQPEREPSAAATVATIRAVAGLRRGSLYAAVDVCRPAAGRTRCSLQVVPLATTAQDQRSPIARDELRERADDPLQEVTLQALSNQSLLLSGVRADGQRSSRRLSVGGGTAEIAPEPDEHAAARIGDRIVQLRRAGPLYFARQTDDRLFGVASAPALTDTTVVTTVAPENGWWITGTDARSGEVAVAVSHDRGRSWTVRQLGVRPGMEDPVVATADGRTVYAFVSTATGVQHRRSTDAGATWQARSVPMPWSVPGRRGDVSTGRLGAVVRTDGSLLVWVDEQPGAAFLESTDEGGSYHPVNGPAGPIMALSDGYVALRDPPAVSSDARTWTDLPGPATIPPD